VRDGKAQIDPGRREFCRKASLATIGACVLSGLPGSEAFAVALHLKSGAVSGSKENKMEKRVKAVMAKVISVRGECGIHKTGDTCTFTETGVQDRVCIHAMYSMLPKVFAMFYGAKFPWLQNQDVATHACPDAANPVVFEITRIYES